MLTRREHATYVLACVLFIVLTVEMFWALGGLIAAEIAA